MKSYCLFAALSMWAAVSASTAQTIFYSNDFEGAVGTEWSNRTTDMTPVGGRTFLGQFSNGSVILTLQRLPAHRQVRLSFDLFIIRTWDGDETADPEGYVRDADIWSVSVWGGPTLLETTFNNHHMEPYVNWSRQSYPGSHPDGGYLPQTDAAETDTLGYTFSFPDIGSVTVDAVYRMQFAFSHTATSLMLEFEASQLTSGTWNESWGLDNVTVELVEEDPEPLTAHDPLPPDGAQNVSPTLLRWQPGRTAVFHDLYLGDRPDLTSRDFLGRLQGTTYLVDPVLAPGTPYYWRVNEVEADGRTIHAGPLWSFTTPEPGPIEQPEMGSSLGEIDCDDPAEFAERVQDNNVENLVNPAYSRVHVEQVEGLDPDRTGMMRMRNLEELDPVSPMRGEMVHARAKAAFNGYSGGQVLVRFSYLFERAAPGLELVAYVSDVPELLDRDDRSYARHYIEIGRVPLPTVGRPGSVNSRRFGIFEQWVSTSRLNVASEIWVELELVEGQASPSTGGRTVRAASLDSGGSGLVDDLAVEVHCDGICMDLNWSDTADEEDFLLVIASCGSMAGLLDGGVGSRYCLDGALSTDGYVDPYDVHSWDWALRDTSRVARNFCRVPLPLADAASGTTGGRPLLAPASPSGLRSAGMASFPADLLIVGKSRGSWRLSDLFADCFCLFDGTGTYLADYSVSGLPARCTIRGIRGLADRVYLVSAEQGVLQIDGSVRSVIPPGEVSYAADPRHGRAARVYVGIQGQGSSCFGRPILDAAFDGWGYAYVVPVVVEPVGEEAYVAAAKLQLQAGANPPYRLVQLYDDPPKPGDNQHRNHLREIEVDATGNVYLVNAHRLNESCIVWKYHTGGTLLRRLDLLAPDSHTKVDDPLALHLSHDGRTLYLASGQRLKDNPTDCMVYGLSTQDLSPARTVTIEQMQFVTSIAEDPTTGSLWVVGFSMPEIPAWPDPRAEPFYLPRLAEVPSAATTATAVTIAGPGTHNLALPTSILWTGVNP